VIGLIVCFQTDFCTGGQYLEVVLLFVCKITLELAIHDRRGGKVWSRLSHRGSVHVDFVSEDVICERKAVIEDRLYVRRRESVGLSKPTCIFSKAWPLILATKSRTLFLQYPFADHHEAGIESGFTAEAGGARMPLSRLHIPSDPGGLSRYSRVIRPGQRLGRSR
jgi:hypothetical protein